LKTLATQFTELTLLSNYNTYGTILQYVQRYVLQMPGSCSEGKEGEEEEDGFWEDGMSFI